jgi:hypothetical protein
MDVGVTANTSKIVFQKRSDEVLQLEMQAKTLIYPKTQKELPRGSLLSTAVALASAVIGRGRTATERAGTR